MCVFVWEVHFHFCHIWILLHMPVQVALTLPWIVCPLCWWGYPPQGDKGAAEIQVPHSCNQETVEGSGGLFGPFFTSTGTNTFLSRQNCFTDLQTLLLDLASCLCDMQCTFGLSVSVTTLRVQLEDCRALCITWITCSLSSYTRRRVMNDILVMWS